MVLLRACVPAACPHMIATQCASFVGALANVHKLSWLDSVNFGPHGLWVITVTNSKHIVNNLNGYEGINLIQSSRPKLQLPDLVCTFCQNSHLWEQLCADVFCQFWPCTWSVEQAEQLNCQLACLGFYLPNLACGQKVCPRGVLNPFLHIVKISSSISTYQGGFCDVFG